MKQELTATREYLQSVIEQQEGANEELQSANEEVQSANEELQSINEELETSKEEIQSANEELATVNDELQHRNQELTQSNNDLTNLLASVELAIIMLGADLRIRRFTPAAEKLFNLIPSDIGRALSDLNLNVVIDDLETLLRNVIDKVEPYEGEIQDRHRRWYLMRLRPYRTSDNRIDGVVVVDTRHRPAKTLRGSVAGKRDALRAARQQCPGADLDERWLRISLRQSRVRGVRRGERERDSRQGGGRLRPPRRPKHVRERLQRGRKKRKAGSRSAPASGEPTGITGGPRRWEFRASRRTAGRRDSSAERSTSPT
jgi:two-component system CheB/CheR fusion protein